MLACAANYAGFLIVHATAKLYGLFFSDQPLIRGSCDFGLNLAAPSLKRQPLAISQLSYPSKHEGIHDQVPLLPI
jgi:hypothetical protein